MLSSPETRRFVIETPLLDLTFQVLATLLTLNIVLFIFNLIPIPPLDGWSVLHGIVPQGMARRMSELEVQYASLLPTIFLGFVIILFVSGGTVPWPAHRWHHRPAPGTLSVGWWAGKIRQAVRHVAGQVSDARAARAAGLAERTAGGPLRLDASGRSASRAGCRGPPASVGIRGSGAAAGGPPARLLQGTLDEAAASRGVVARRALR